MRLVFLRRHDKFRDQVDAYLDGELLAASATRFESHAAACGSCSAALREARELKALFASLTPVEAPRSFRLTPDMVAATAPSRPRPTRQPAMALRLAQMTAGVAIMALATVAAIDFAGGNSSSDGQSMMATGAAESAKNAPLAQSAATASGGGTVSRDSASPPVLPTPISGGAGAASNGPETSTPPVAGASQRGAAATPGTSGTNSLANPYGTADSFAPIAAHESEGETGLSGLRMTEVALLALAAVAAAAWLLLARRSRRS